MKLINHLAAGLICLSAVSSCTYREYETFQTKIEISCYPQEVAKIFMTNCAQSGCHDAKSKGAAGGLDLSTWQALFEGANGGTPVIAFSPGHSYLLNFINDGHDPDITSQQPLMPYNLPPLSQQEYQLIKNWIANGAPDCNDHRFSDNPDRDKIYISNQGCDLIYVLDADKLVVMNAFYAGGNDNILESPHMIRFSPDGQFYYICHSADPAARYFEKYRSSDDQRLGILDIGAGGWNTFDITPDGKTAFVIDYKNTGRIAIVDCENLTLKPGWPFNPITPDPMFNFSHGSRMAPGGKHLYVTMQNGNSLYKMYAPGWNPDSNKFITFPPGLSLPHEMEFSPDGSMYFVTCQGTGDVKIFNAATDAFLKSIPTALDPVEMSIAESKNLLFVSCMQGDAVSIINYADTLLVKTISNIGKQPHGIAVDEKRGMVYVGCRNANPNGPAPHHVSECGGRNGYLVAIDLETLEPVPGFRIELSVDPYSVRARP